MLEVVSGISQKTCPVSVSTFILWKFIWGELDQAPTPDEPQAQKVCGFYFRRDIFQ
jgi:hypothetical protein